LASHGRVSGLKRSQNLSQIPAQRGCSRSGAPPTAPVVDDESVESNVNEPGRPENRPECHYIGLALSDACREIFLRVSHLLFALAGLAVVSLLFPAVFRCFLAAAGFKKPEFPRLSEVRSLYFSALSAGISERSGIGRAICAPQGLGNARLCNHPHVSPAGSMGIGSVGQG
jgi:hypothetical protein